MAVRKLGEPISQGRMDRALTNRQSRSSMLYVAVLFGAIVIVNGLLAMGFIELSQAIGWWPLEREQAQT